jgi:hypothetical protein
MAVNFDVRGHVQLEDGSSAPGLKVQAFDKDLRSEQPLGSAVTDPNGDFEIAYTSDQFSRAEKQTADLVVRAYGAEGEELGTSGIMFNAPQAATLDLTLAPAEIARVSEYERLVDDVTPVLDGVAVSDLTDDDITFLVGETRTRRQLLVVLRQSSQLARSSGLAAEALYGLGRQGVPLDVERLVALPTAALLRALIGSISRNIIPARVRDTLDTIAGELDGLRRAHPPITSHPVRGRLLDADSALPVAGFVVGALDLDAGVDARDLGYTRTGRDGSFVISYAAADSSQPDGNARRLRLRVLDPQRREVSGGDVVVAAQPGEVVVVRVKSPPPLDGPSPLVSDLAATVELSMPAELEKALEANGIRTLDDVRKAGGISHLPAFPVTPNDPTVQTLEAHANLGLLSDDVQVNAQLIEQGYTSISAVATATRSDIGNALGTQVGAFNAAQLHIAAGAMSGYLDNRTMELRSAKANGFDHPGYPAQNVKPAVDAMFDKPCGCDDCRAAVGPAAYLADLLAYALGHVKDDAKPLTLERLTLLLHQPFGHLSTSCDAVQEQIRQIRICVEALRSYFKAFNVAPLSAKQETAYRLDAYETALVELGTSYGEVRTSRGASFDARRDLADRLGFDLRPAGPDPVQALFLDPDAQAADPHVLSEATLERLIGLPDTTRDPLSRGAKTGDPQAQITRWRLSGSELGRNTDPDGFGYVRLSSSAAAEFTVELYRDPARTQLVADGHRSSATGIVSLIERNASGLTGTVTIDFSGGSNTTVISAIPAVLAWRLQHLRTVWAQQDRLDDLYSQGESLAALSQLPQGIQFPAGLAGKIGYDAANEVLTFDGVMDDSQQAALLALSTDPPYQSAVQQLFQESQRPPVIDPDLIGPDDFRAPFAKTDPGGPDAAFDLWLRRRGWVDDRLKNLRDIQKVVGGNAVPDLEAMTTAMTQGVTYGTVTLAAWTTPVQWTDLETIATDLSEAADPEATRQRIHTELALSVDAFTRLIDIHHQDLLAAADPGSEGVNPDEWDEVYSILVQAQKTRFAATWRSEEADIVFGPDVFWSSLREPRPGTWPPPAGIPAEPRPTIDPELLTINDLPEPVTGRLALELWQARRGQLDEIRATLQAVRESDGLDAALRHALGTPGTTDPLPADVDLNALLADLNSNDPGVAAAATAKIHDGLYMASDAFIALMAVKAKDDDPNPATKPTTAEWAGLYSTLTSAEKEHREYPAWITAEQLEGLDGGYWRARKAALPPWRASTAARDSWRQALSARSTAPLLDPDLIHPADMRDPLPGHPPFDLWQQRTAWTTAQLAALKTELTGGAGLSLVEKYDATIAASLIEPATIAGTNADLKAMRQSRGLEAVLIELWGDEVGQAAALLDALTSGGDPTKTDAQRTIADSLYLSPADFQQLMQIRAKDQADNPQDPVTSSEWDAADAVLTHAASSKSIFGLQDDAAAGKDIGPSLQQFSLTTDAFDRLTLTRELLASSKPGEDPLLASEWDDVCSILVEVRKRRSCATWRETERTAGVVLGPDQFQPSPPPATGTLSPQAPPLPAWRATSSDRDAWQTTLRARIGQQKDVVRALEDVIAAAEVQGLPILRDALVAATDATPLSLSTKAQAIANTLLIDAQTDSCQVTTRTAQAIDTLQTLLFSLRTSQLDSHPSLSLDADHFDLDWQSMGSYANWRALMFVFLYPENILVPSLRRWQTPPFRALVESSRDDWGFDPHTACQLAHDYATYFQDICNLTIEATCRARTHVIADPCADPVATQAPPYQDLLYLFARASTSKTLYFSTIDPGDDTGYAQSFWVPVDVTGLENLDNVKIIGSVPYERTDDDGRPYHFLYLFLSTETDGKPGVVFLRYDLDNAAWTGELQTLDFPQTWKVPDTEDQPWQLTRLQTFAVQRAWNDMPPTLILTGQYTGISDQYTQPFLYARSLDQTGSAWGGPAAELTDNFATHDEWAACDVTTGLVQSGSDWTILRDSGIVAVLEVESAPSFQQLIFCLKDGPGYKNYLAPLVASGVRFWEVKGSWLGATPSEYLPEDLDDAVDVPASISVFYNHEGTVYRQVAILRAHETGFRPPVPWLQSLARVIPDYGAFPSPGRRHSICELSPPTPSATDAQAGSYDVIVATSDLSADMNSVGEQWDEIKRTRVTPKVADPTDTQVSSFEFDITDQLSADELQKKRQAIATWYPENDDGGGSGSTLCYLDEAYYYVPVQLALQLQKRGFYEEALDWFRTVYDYSAPAAVRKIYYGLVAEESLPDTYVRSPDWLRDPANPHAFASGRLLTNTRFVLLSIVRCLLAFADDEFTRDTPESNARARVLYLTALRLLDLPALKQHLGTCQEIIGTLSIDIDPELTAAFGQLAAALGHITGFQALSGTIAGIQQIMTGAGDWTSRFTQAGDLIAAATAAVRPPSFAETVLGKASTTADVHAELLAEPAIAAGAVKAGTVARQQFTHVVSSVAGLNPSQLKEKKADMPWLADHAGPGASAQLQDVLITIYPPGPFSVPAAQFCVPANPVIRALRQHAEANLFKLRNCRNFAGMIRELQPYAGATDTSSGMPTIGPGDQLLPQLSPDGRGSGLPPTRYRYSVVIDRAKQLVALAQQAEAAFLSMLENGDAERYTALRAKQDVALTAATVNLQSLKVAEAEAGVDLAQLQQQRSEIQVDHYNQLLTEGISSNESLALAFMASAGAASTLGGLASAGELDIGGALSAFSQGMSTAGTIAATYANYERRAQEWQFQEDLAQQDVTIGQQQVAVATAQVAVASQEATIAQLQATQAVDTVNFLASKFTNADLYDWMSGVMEGVYRFFLRQATATAQIALLQLAFERQEIPPPFIEADYWQAPTDSGSTTTTNGTSTDRRGLTGSARLLQDIYQLDQYAFDTAKRKLQLSKTISLAQLAPAEFQRFRETGTMTFATTTDMFDRDFPGHYLRLIRTVHTSVIALIPPTEGIHATLTTSGTSRTVIGADTFQTVIVNAGPQAVALTSPTKATGVFELDQQPEMLLPFEGTGVDTTWEFRMPRAANLIDYDSIADVLITIDYTALNSSDHYREVIQTLEPAFSADRAFSFRQELADQWFDLHNPDQTATPMSVRWTTRREDFPSNLSDLTIQQVALYFVRAEDAAFEVSVSHLRFVGQGYIGEVGGGATSIDGVISTRKGNAGSWTPIVGRTPMGVWELELPDTQEARDRFKNDEIAEMLFVITYSGRTSDWPAYG